MSTPTSTTEIQRRVRIVLCCAQVVSSLGNGSTLALGSILAVELSGDEALAGTATTALGLGAALAAVPLARLAAARGRRVALGAGLLLAIAGTFAMVGAVLASSYALLAVGSLLVGVATAVNLQARFAVTDLAEPQHRGRDLSLVVWAITVGAVLGPNTGRPGAALANVLGLPTHAGAFVISAAGMVVGGTVILLFLRPDPLLVRRRLDDAPPMAKGAHTWAAGARIVAAHPVALAAVVGLVGAHATMVGVMSMTPLHIAHHMHDAGSPDTLEIIGMTISLHIAGMYALSPVMGVLTDRFGAYTVTAGGLVGTLAAALLAGFGSAHLPVVTAALVLLGLGWSAASVAGATMLTSALPPTQRVEAQGFGDALVSLVGALSAALAGIVMGRVDYLGVGIAYGAVTVGAFLVLLALGRRTASRSAVTAS
ncbi:putative major facilitator superfamily transporter [Mobilicoccus pelagius NBRC 104925]|uniref:Putative major facilitator superfamily transporter n=1 Tax=Mobilicoccus pelagius NBRC 104925 TaxID=1089455 RepID=H5UNQ8_9MICO|nr:MFS transporter [Mobilicoccus pelagius]GAB47366.1 putative major facilitator superfamily transporter [Mobilicoccus pelagius NBRC 104925]